MPFEKLRSHENFEEERYKKMKDLFLANAKKEEEAKKKEGLKNEDEEAEYRRKHHKPGVFKQGGGPGKGGKPGPFRRG